MTSPNTTHNSLKSQLERISLKPFANNLDAFIAQASKDRWSARKIIEELCRIESSERARLSLEHRLRFSGIGRFKPIADFDWDWPKKIDRVIIEQTLSLDFIHEGRNLIFIGGNGLGKTMIAQNIAHNAVMAGHSVLFRSAADIIQNLQCDSPMLRKRRLQTYIRPQLLVIDEVAYLSFDDNAADLLYEVVNRRYERKSIIITTNRPFKDWNQVFPNATCIATLLDRLTHHADVTAIDGDSYRLHESQLEADKRRRNIKK
jgi:DNA replication protein DnaC